MKTSAPGKLFIAGEWALLEPKNFGIVTAVNKRIFAEVKKSADENIYITLSDFGINNIKVIFSGDKLKFLKKLTKKEEKILAFSKMAMETALRYLKNYQPFKLKIGGDEINPVRNRISNGARKIGFGFSAASTVAVIAALLKFHKKAFTKEEIFKLSALSHYLAQGKIGSGFDIAASVFGGIFVYRRFNPVWLEKEIRKEKDVRKIIKKSWPNFYLRRLNFPKNLNLLIGWTGKSALTPQLIKKLNEWKQKNQPEYRRLIFGIGGLVKELIKAWRAKNKEKIIGLIRKNEDYLRELGEKSGVSIETQKLKKLSEIAEKFGGAGKLSGAGAGDCGIALTFDKKTVNRIKKEWKKNGILPIKAAVDFSGVKTH